MTAKSFREYQEEKREREWAERVKKQKESMGNAQRIERAGEWKRIGNEKFKAGNYWEARDYYREAIIYVEDMVEARRKERDELLVPLYSNLAQVDLKVEEYDHAESVAGKALEILERPRSGFHPSHRAKAHFRRGLARRRLQRTEEACEDFAAAVKLQPDAEDLREEHRKAKEELRLEGEKCSTAMRGFLLGTAAKQAESREEKEQKRREAELLREEKRKERRALAEQRQQMQAAFTKLAEGKMLYEKREQEMEPVRKREEEKQKQMELEMNLMNIIDDSNGKAKSSNLDEFMERKQANAVEQGQELDQKKKILDKQKKEEKWDEDDTWQAQRAEHRRRLEAEREAGRAQPAPPSLWQATEVARWCEQRLRDTLVGISCPGVQVPSALLAAFFLDKDEKQCEGLELSGLVTDALKLDGDATVMRLNPHKPPLHYFDYFVKLDWEVALATPGAKPYRTANELIGAAAKEDEGKAPKSVLEHCVLAGTFKLREYCSEADNPTESWRLETKVKKKFSEDGTLLELASEVCQALRRAVEMRLAEWPDEFRNHWQC
mmetsp:Transcript_65878/g.157485  ORF Transcript_65878/g.157485 Transcript_65878/m.157485 type:complete len:551 (+) Transcript_65878:80-1732(+)